MAENYCRECGFAIFDEQLRTMLCDECFALPKSERLSARKEQRERDARLREEQREQVEQQRQQVSVRIASENWPFGGNAVDWADMLRQVRERHRESQRERVGDLQAENLELRRQVEELRRQIEAKEIHEEIVPEVKSFLRNFDNLDLEGEDNE